MPPKLLYDIMNITREDIDALNAVVKVDIAKEDYSDKVEKILSDYRKSANIPGFRKGHVPMTLVKKQYGKAVLVDEVNKLLQDGLNKYLTEEKLDVLGNPLPKPQDNLDWNADQFSFEFELGLAPKFEVNLKSKKAIVHYNIIADEKMLKNQVEHIQKQYGKLVSQDKVGKDSEITGVFVNDEKGIKNSTTLTFDKLKSKTAEKALLGSKVGDVITLKTKGLFNDDHDLMHFLKVSHDDAHGLDIEVNFSINEVNKRELADLDQELFDKLFGKGVVTSVTELKNKIKEDSEKHKVLYPSIAGNDNGGTITNNFSISGWPSAKLVTADKTIHNISPFGNISDQVKKFVDQTAISISKFVSPSLTNISDMRITANEIKFMSNECQSVSIAEYTISGQTIFSRDNVLLSRGQNTINRPANCRTKGLRIFVLTTKSSTLFVKDITN